MSLAKQAKTLSRAQVDATLGYLSTTRHPNRNRLILLLSVRAGLRSKEIANLTWNMVTGSDGEVGSAIHLTNDASKGSSGGRAIPLSRELRFALVEQLRCSKSLSRPSQFVITTERTGKTSAQVVVNLFSRWYADLGFDGCSSHSGRRTAITNWARRISTVGGSLRDVQLLAGHSALSMTQRYIDADGLAQRRVVEMA